jgi:hypothetical protein
METWFSVIIEIYSELWKVHSFSHLTLNKPPTPHIPHRYNVLFTISTFFEKKTQENVTINVSCQLSMESSDNY